MSGPGYDAAKRAPEGNVLRGEGVRAVKTVQGKARERDKTVGIIPRNRRGMIHVAGQGDAGLRPFGSQPCERRKGKNDVTQGAGVKNEYLHYWMIMSTLPLAAMLT